MTLRWTHTFSAWGPGRVYGAFLLDESENVLAEVYRYPDGYVAYVTERVLPTIGAAVQVVVRSGKPFRSLKSAKRAVARRLGVNT